MELDLEQMRSVVVLAEHRNFGRAAAALFISQPALTKQIRKIEETLGGTLFIRKPRQLTLTRAGEVFVERARALLLDAKNAVDVSRSAIRGEAGLLRIGFGLPSMATGLPDLIQKFRRRFPLVQISLREMSTPPQLTALASGALDVGFVRLPIQDERIRSVPLFGDRLMIVASVHCSKKSGHGLRQFAMQPFIVVSRSASASLHDHVMRTCNAAGFSPQIVQEAAELFTVLNFVRAGAGVALVPNSCRVMNVPEIRFLNTGIASASWKVGIAYHKSRDMDPAIRNFVSMARESAKGSA
ncbi:LysR family transcriptional regulator [Occallatibacter riparius]|uniref:LysR substrate-binding domain-containing protein n=1 Tax=Occallatibacter riparius TaxID=1002689 RepID=A0A9J7BJP5_9BACT|nr:LysR family transcriptional regulator [Occallatibacter riparius]UWZ83124.1 LysR substrate-binding domain-containing protein [Occallatibacter riparius]